MILLYVSDTLLWWYTTPLVWYSWCYCGPSYLPSLCPIVAPSPSTLLSTSSPYWWWPRLSWRGSSVSTVINGIKLWWVKENYWIRFGQQSRPSISEEINAGNIYSDITDHLPNFAIIKQNTRKTQTNSRPMVRIFGQNNEEKFKQKLHKANWEPVYATQNEDTALNNFFNIYNKAFNESFPIKMLSRKRAKDKKWMTTGLRRAIHTKNQLYKKYLNKPNKENREKHRIHRNKLNKCLRMAEENHYQELLENEKHNLRLVTRWDPPLAWISARGPLECDIGRVSKKYFRPPYFFKAKSASILDKELSCSPLPYFLIQLA